jgi:hypothetical protein
MELGEYHLNILPASRKLVIAQHLRTCPHCTREIAQLESFLKDTAPVSLLAQAKVIVARLAGAVGQAGLAPIPIALRGEARGPITLEADGIVIVLDLRPATGGKASILGQVAAANQDEWTGARVELSQADQYEFSTTLDDLGAFRLESVPVGTKQLRIIPGGEALIVVAEFEISV